MKNEEGVYTLSEFGKAGLNLLQKVEEPVKAEADELPSFCHERHNGSH
jgi:hypothetical protein